MIIKANMRSEKEKKKKKYLANSEATRMSHSFSFYLGREPREPQ